MTDTPRTVAALQALFADNATGNISAQDLRDFLVTVVNYLDGVIIAPTAATTPLTLNPQSTAPYGLLMNLPAGFDANANARFQIQIAGDPSPSFLLDSGGIDMHGGPGTGSTGMTMREDDNPSRLTQYRSDTLSITQASGAILLAAASDKVLARVPVIVGWNSLPADGLLAAGDLALWFDKTNGASKLMLKGKSANGTVVTGQVALS